MKFRASSDFLSHKDAILGMFPYPVNAEAYRFSLACQAYQESEKPAFDAINIWINCFKYGPSFATFLKRVKEKSQVQTMRGKYIYDPEWTNEVPGFNLDDIGQVFNYKYLFNWQEPEESDIKQYCSIPVLPPDKETVEVFRSCLTCRLATIKAELITRVHQNEVLLDSSSKSEASGLPHAVRKYTRSSENYMASFFGASRSAFIQKTPGDCRDIIICPIATSNRIKWIDKQLMEIIKHFPECCQVRDPTLFYERVSSLKDSHWFVCRDLEKEGLTKPRWLLEVILEELWSFFKLPAFEPTGFFTDIIIDGISYPRGHGLGMANALTTLAQIVIHDMTLDYMKDVGREIECSARFFNDDSAIGFTYPEDAEDYHDADGETLFAIRHRRKENKSWIGRGYVLCENFFMWDRPGLSQKQSYWNYIAMKPLYAVNISHAKEISCGLGLNQEILSKYRKLYLSQWGYEFFPEESFLPAAYGGWGNFHLGGVNLDLFLAGKARHIEDPLLQKAYAAHLVKTSPPKQLLKKRYNKIFGKVIRDGKPTNLNPVEDMWLCSVSECETLGFPTSLEGCIDKTFNWRYHPEAFMRHWELHKKRRKIAYGSHLKLTAEKMLAWVTETQDQDILPPENMWLPARWDPVYYEEKQGRAYHPDFPIMSSIAWARQRPVNGVMPNGLSANHISSWRKLIPGEAWSFLQGFSIDLTLPQTYKKARLWCTQDNDITPYHEVFLEPNSMCEVMCLLGLRHFPFLTNQNRNLKLKEEIWGSILTSSEEGYVGHYKGAIDILISLVKDHGMDLDMGLVEDAENFMIEEFGGLESDTASIKSFVFSDDEEDDPADKATMAWIDPDVQTEKWIKSAYDVFTFANSSDWTGGVGPLDISAWGANPAALKHPVVRRNLREALSANAYWGLLKANDALMGEEPPDEDDGYLDSEYGINLFE